ncbi:MAG: SusD/RagB family nutrient-binding outer membrane lipoprotein [Chitinophagaceae bacterium]|nr:SusD/RagB family nutrient-binding outer membrane lipoprotein [Chitinophagaceae bacterium]
MKNISIKKFAAAALITSVILGTGCAKISEFGDTNNNPNGITNPPPSALLTNVGSQMGGFASNLRRAVYAQYIAENQYTEVSLYALPLLEMSGTYSGPLNDLQTIINVNSNPATAGAASADGSNANQIAIARILKAYIYWTVTDAWGDIPYSEALLGAANLTPKFDKQEDVYFGMISELKQAAASFDVGTPIKGDILYGGNTASWKRLANSMRMMMAMRMSQRYPAAGGLAAVEFADAATADGGYITDNSQNFKIAYPGGAYQNPWYLTYLTRDDYASSKTMGDVLNGLGDTRSTVYGTNSVMFPYGLTRDLAVAYGNSVGNGQSRVLAVSKRLENSPVSIIPASLVLLASAEAKERGWIPGGSGSAELDYNAAITASFNEWGVAMPGGYLTGTANFNAGVGVPGSIGAEAAPYDNFRAASGNLQDAATPNKLSRIALQRWVCAFPNGQEGWAEQRRTGVPNLKTTRFNTGPFVTRYVYGNTDYGLNNANTLAAAASIGGDNQDTKVWWDN